MIRFGIVGAGNIAHKFANDIRFTEYGQLVAVASRSLEKATAFKEEHNIPYAFGSYEEMAKSNLIDAVYIATPHNFHKEQTILFLQSKKHVLCEKPLAVNTKQASEMIDVAQQEGMLLMEAMWTRYLPLYRYLDEVLKTNKLGSILNIDLRFGIQLTDDNNTEGRILNPKLAGGSLLDIGIYPLSIFRYFSHDTIKELHTEATFAQTGVDLYVKIDMVLDNKKNTTVHLESAVDRELSNTAIVTFEKGTVTIPHFWWGNELHIDKDKMAFPFKNEGFEFEIDAFSKTIMDKQLQNPIMTHNESLDVLRLMDEIRAKIGLKYPFE